MIAAQDWPVGSGPDVIDAMFDLVDACDAVDGVLDGVNVILGCIAETRRDFGAPLEHVHIEFTSEGTPFSDTFRLTGFTLEAGEAPVLIDEILEAPVRTCRVCGCTDERACDPPCWWVADIAGAGDLCSACA